MKFVDVHIHLTNSLYSQKVKKILLDARKLGVLGVVSNSVDLETSYKNLKIAEEFPGQVYAAIGIHPWNTKKLKPKEVEDTINLILKNQGNQNKLVAIGEIGLDASYSGDGEPTSIQKQVFHKMLKTAEKTSLPVIIHSRGASSQILKNLPSYNIKKVLLHWFSQPLSLIPTIIDRNYFISEGPPILYSGGLRKLIKKIPLTHLLTETDGPVRFREPFKGKLTTPSFIPQIVEAIAEIKEKNKNDVSDQILTNYTNFFNTVSVRDKRHDEGTIRSY
ncbi:TatD family hydrolase [Candidatus Bathyarchaeota archaeon]|nr:TatD family hydrolase [Candidatus Bathyarchaeota archaeon]